MTSGKMGCDVIKRKKSNAFVKWETRFDQRELSGEDRETKEEELSVGERRE